MKTTTLLKWCDGCSTVCFTVFLARWFAMSSKTFYDFLFFIVIVVLCGVMIYGVAFALSDVRSDFKKKFLQADSDKAFFVRSFISLFWFVGLPWDVSAFDLRFLFALVMVVICTVGFVLFKKRENFSVLIMTILCVCTVTLLFKPYTKTENEVVFPRSAYWHTTSDALGKKLNQLYQQRSDLAHLQFSQDEADKIMGNPFNISFAEQIVAQKIKEQKLVFPVVKENSDSISTVFINLKRPEYEKTMQHYTNKEEKLTIKRLWLNSNVLPWTYEAYTSFSFQHSHSYSLFSSSCITDLRVNGSADYQGDYKLDYINVILSDNTYLRYQIKDNPEWLLAQEGDKVLRRYKDKGFKLDTSIAENLTCDMVDLCFKKEYVLQFKN